MEGSPSRAASTASLWATVSPLSSRTNRNLFASQPAPKPAQTFVLIPTAPAVWIPGQPSLSLTSRARPGLVVRPQGC